MASGLDDLQRIIEEAATGRRGGTVGPRKKRYGLGGLAQAVANPTYADVTGKLGKASAIIGGGAYLGGLGGVGGVGGVGGIGADGAGSAAGSGGFSLPSWVLPAAAAGYSAYDSARQQGQSNDLEREALDLARQDYADRAPLREGFTRNALTPIADAPDLSAVFADPSNPFYTGGTLPQVGSQLDFSNIPGGPAGPPPPPGTLPTPSGSYFGQDFDGMGGDPTTRPSDQPDKFKPNKFKADPTVPRIGGRRR